MVDKELIKYLSVGYGLSLVVPEADKDDICQSCYKEILNVVKLTPLAENIWMGGGDLQMNCESCWGHYALNFPVCSKSLTIM